MGIQALPDTTVRTLGASQVLTDSAAVVKELVDNALDANATSISIEISNNTVDSIQVRDNGHGIPPEDRQLVAKPHCTSKIAGEDDLNGIGGTSLGFRGEALASVAEMSGSLTISTKVEGEQVAVALKINQQGEVAGQERASLPVGTTVKITDYMKALAVRRQTALKNAEKCLKKIKYTLQSYAFARPHVRMSLRVLKAKNSKGDWTYAPKPGGNAEDAAFKIVGAACASQCTWSIVEDQGFTLQAFLPRPDADATKVGNIGAFLSIDARPVTVTRGTAKQIVKMFREALKNANAGFDGIIDPFVFLEIACPPGSYDANIEPAKDDVLFEDPQTVVDAAKQLFGAAYPVQEVTASVEKATPTPAVSQTQQAQSAEIVTRTLFSPPQCDHAPPHAHSEQAIAPDTEQRTVDWLANLDDCAENQDPGEGRRRAFRPNMYGCDEEDLDLIDARPLTGRTEAGFEELRRARKDVTVSNPWVMAKMNAPIRRPIITPDNEELRTVADGATTPAAPLPRKLDRPLIDLEAPGLPTPRPSSPSLPTEGFHPSNFAPDVQLTRDGRLMNSQSLPAPVAQMISSSNFDEYVGEVEPPQPPHQRPSYDYRLPLQGAEAPNCTPLHSIPAATARARLGPKKRPQQSQVNPPFVSPLIDQPQREKVWFDHLEGLDQGRPRPAKKRHFQPHDSNGLVVQGELGDLLEAPRPLTPPRRNRDMRDFVTPMNPVVDDSAASLVESRNFVHPDRARLVEAAGARMTATDNENSAPAQGVLGARGFMPASELAAVEAHFVGAVRKYSPRPPKRRKTGEARVLREISSNSRAHDAEDDEEYRETPDKRAVSRRRRTTDGDQSKPRRSKSSRLPLERVPEGQGTHQLVVNMATSADEISRSAGKIDEERTLLGWTEPALDAYDSFAIPYRPNFVQSLAAKLRDVLVRHVPDSEMVQDLALLVQTALTTHEQATANFEDD